MSLGASGMASSSIPKSANDLYKDHDDSDPLALVNRRVDLSRKLRHLTHHGSTKLFVIRADDRTKAP